MIPAQGLGADYFVRVHWSHWISRWRDRSRDGEPHGGLPTVNSTNGFTSGVEILLINLQGAAGNTVDVGNCESLDVASVKARPPLNECILTLFFIFDPDSNYRFR